MTPEEIAADRALIEASSPGPWTHGLGMILPDSGIEAADNGSVCHVTDHGNVNTIARTGEQFSHADARFIAAARTRWLVALNEVERLQKLLGDHECS